MALLLSQGAFEAHAAPATKVTTATTPKPVNQLAPPSELRAAQAAAYASVPSAPSEHQIVCHKPTLPIAIICTSYRGVGILPDDGLLSLNRLMCLCVEFGGRMFEVCGGRGPQPR